MRAIFCNSPTSVEQTRPQNIQHISSMLPYVSLTLRLGDLSWIRHSDTLIAYPLPFAILRNNFSAYWQPKDQSSRAHGDGLIILLANDQSTRELRWTLRGHLRLPGHDCIIPLPINPKHFDNESSQHRLHQTTMSARCVHIFHVDGQNRMLDPKPGYTAVSRWQHTMCKTLYAEILRDND